MSTPLRTPHGLHMPCNWYCAGDEHAVIVLGESGDDACPTTPASIIAGCSAYYASVGWQVLRAKRIEADAERILASMQQTHNAGPVHIEPCDTVEHALPANVESYEPWMLVLGPRPSRKGTP